MIECPICAKPIPSADINRHLDSDHFEPSSHLQEPKTINQSSPQATTTSGVQSTLNFHRNGSSNAQNKTSRSGSIKRPHPKTQASDNQPTLTLSSSPPPPTFLASTTPSHSRKKSRLDSESLIKPPLPTPSSSSAPSASNKPLAERVRPKTIEEFQGQTHIRSALQTIVSGGNSVILWGPPGSGKTTLARCLKNLLINDREKKNDGQPKYEYYELSATDFSTSEWKKILDLHHLSTCSSFNSSNGSNQKISSFYKPSVALLPSIPLIFVDEVQRLNKSQQDLFLPFIENGRIVMIFATTENPSFRLTTPLLSRCRLLKLNQHSSDELKLILERALAMEKASSGSAIGVDSQMIDLLSNVADGDARVALSHLEIIINALKRDPLLDHHALKEIIGNKFLLYDRNGDNHYDLISALHKSIRGGDADAGLYWLARMLEGGEDPLYVARRLIRMASEDIGQSNPTALPQAVSAYQATQLIGMPECDCILGQVVVMLAESPKSVRTYIGYNRAKALVNSLPSYPVPIHLRNAPTKMMKELGYGAEYKYEPDYAHPIYQEFVPSEVLNRSTKNGLNEMDNHYPFLVPRSKRIDQQTSSSSDDRFHNDPLKNMDDSLHQIDDNTHNDHHSKLANQTPVVSPPAHRSTKHGKLVDLGLLREWEEHFNDGQPWIGRHRLQQ